jgi:hypothetical protein
MLVCSSSDYSTVGGTLWLCVLVALGIYYLVISNTSGGEYTGTLVAAGRYYDSNSDGGGNWYVTEKFLKGNTTNACTVTRLQTYSTVHAVNDAKDKVQLYTTRKIWTRWNDDTKCYDTSVKNYETTTGIVLLCFSMAVPLVLLIAISSVACNRGSHQLFDTFRSRYNRRHQDPEVVFSNRGNHHYREIEKEHGSEPQTVARSDLEDDSQVKELELSQIPVENV